MNLYRIQAIFIITFKRLWSQKGLTLATLVGLVAGVTLIMLTPLYADAVSFRVLQTELSSSAQRAYRPPFTYFYDYVGSWYGAVEWDDTRGVDEYLRGRGGQALGLPRELFTSHFETNRYRLYPPDVSDYEDPKHSLGYVNFAYTEDIEDHIRIIEGQFPEPADPSPDSTVNVLVTEPMALELGLQVGDEFTAYGFQDEGSYKPQIPVRVAGVWQPLDENDPFWFYRPSIFNDLLLVPKETFVNRLAPYLDKEVYLAVWYLVMDGSGVDTEDVDPLIGREAMVAKQVDALLPKTSSKFSAADALRRYRHSVRELTVLLTAFNVPIIGLVLAYIMLIVGLAVEQRRNEIAVMRSRGATRWQIVALAVLEGAVLGLIALALSLILALLLTQLMGKTRSFLDFNADYTLRAALNQTALRAGVLAVVLAIIAQALPTLAASRDTVITYKQELARSGKRPWWQRAWIDVLLLLLTLYGFYVLQQQGSLMTLGASEQDLFSNPLLILLPFLAVFSLTLLFIRFFPWLMEGISWLFNRTDSVALLLASRQLARTPRAYATPLILLVMTVSLATFTSSLALTLDLQLFDQAFYKIGSDLRLQGPGLALMPGGAFGGGGGSEGGDGSVDQGVFLPMQEYLEFPGVESATRVGRYQATAHVAGKEQKGKFLGVDRADFARSADWRWDFSQYRLGTLMNMLAANPDGVLVSRDFMEKYGLRPGDSFRLTVSLADGDVELNTVVLGAFDLFPTWYPEKEGALFVGNLDMIFAEAGGEFPYEVWMRTEPNLDKKAFDQALRERRLYTWRWKEPYTGIAEEQGRPERQGLFGQLSIGFIAASLLTILGFFSYALFSFHRRFITLGILRAIGLSTKQMIIIVGFELATLILIGLSLGTVLGVWISQLFIPYLQLGSKLQDLVPPYLVEIAWPAIYQIYFLFLLLFLIVLATLAILLQRMKIFQATKLGETA